jgi:hypothetical protein
MIGRTRAGLIRSIVRQSYSAKARLVLVSLNISVVAEPKTPAQDVSD